MVDQIPVHSKIKLGDGGKGGRNSKLFIKFIKMLSSFCQYLSMPADLTSFDNSLCLKLLREHMIIHASVSSLIKSSKHIAAISEAQFILSPSYFLNIDGNFVNHSSGMKQHQPFFTDCTPYAEKRNSQR